MRRVAAAPRRPRLKSAIRSPAPAAKRKARGRKPSRPRRRQSEAEGYPFGIIVPVTRQCWTYAATDARTGSRSKDALSYGFCGTSWGQLRRRFGHHLAQKSGGQRSREHGAVFVLLDFQAIESFSDVRIGSLPRYRDFSRMKNRQKGVHLRGQLLRLLIVPGKSLSAQMDFAEHR